MTTSLRARLILSYFAIAILTATLIYFLIRLTSDQQFKTLVLEQQISEIMTETVHWHEQEGSWDGFFNYFIALHPPNAGPPRSSERDTQMPAPPPPSDRPIIGKHGIVDSEKRIVIRFQDFGVGDIVPDAQLVDARPIIVDQQTVGWIVPDNNIQFSLVGEETAYLQRTNQVLLTAGLLGVVVALLMGLWFARVLLRPIYALTQASEAMAQGDLKQQVPIHRDDELGKLAATFNSMSHEVALAHQHRRQMTADIAHDLSTPLQIISGYVEAIQDGDLEPTSDRMNIIASELEHLRRLIEDLDLLAITDTQSLTLNIETIALNNYLPQLIASFQPLAAAQSIDLRLQTSALPIVSADQARLTQVLGNILNNALRYTPSGGQILVDGEKVGDQVQLSVRDSGVGIAPNELPRVFDRFFQADQQRSNAGKLGLGLAISKALVEAMGGQISAESSGENHGTLFTICLPA